MAFIAAAGVIRGSAGYAGQAEALVARYEALPFDVKHAAILDLLPAAPCRVLDIGAGSGADAAELAARGHQVLAVEPTAELRRRGAALHASTAIEWLDDSLPALVRVVARGERYPLVMLTAVWMHLDPGERGAAMPVLAALLAPAGRLAMTLRHGPVPPGRVMFEVSGDETVALARRCGLVALRHRVTPSLQAANREAGITWSRLVWGRADDARPA